MIYKCKICGEIYVSEKEFDNHNIRKHEQKSLDNWAKGDKQLTSSKMTNVSKILIVMPIMLLLAFGIVFAATPYQSGYEHGLHGGYAYNSASHTQAFNQGYIDGFCLHAPKYAGSDSDQGTFICADDATQYKRK